MRASSGGTLAQVLLLANSDEIEGKFAPDGRVAKLVKAKKADAEIVEELYLTAYSRRPTAAEAEKTGRFRRARRTGRRRSKTCCGSC